MQPQLRAHPVGEEALVSQLQLSAPARCRCGCSMPLALGLAAPPRRPPRLADVGVRCAAGPLLLLGEGSRGTELTSSSPPLAASSQQLPECPAAATAASNDCSSSAS